MPASAVSSVRIDDPIAEVYYDVVGPDGTIYQSNLNSSEICSLGDGHYTVILHSEPLRAASDPGSFYNNLVNYGYAFLFLCVLVFIAGGLSGVFLGQFIRRRA
ncbi:hypothetical protein SDC9_162731 [bioreactor metagenome]|uniref:Uncharacterized protein n=1 Tax=bioreactor metagenome TaxID=1076179 RepID=A0A645FPV7_9ZZZZ